MKTKITEWFDTEANEARYGVKVMIGGVWHNLIVDDKPYIVNSKYEAELMRANFRKKEDPRPKP